MRRIDALGIVLGVFVAGGLFYVIFQQVGLDAQSAGIWTQALLVAVLVGWLLTYLSRAVNNKMTYHEQRDRYENAYFTKRLEELTPEELERIQAEIEQDKQ
ncbi:DUF3007 family protein [Brunnivagina elsteri]|uniref:DUF3007 domain-containing protein n=1 Tax=Brunnivagina elsteri CCALA 953 TaxID=987040 RepID=A0A2A2TAW2_9CYAN|nr:DUF3007 family protein [Calothrix elsteri]PAX48284.1 hypothetical protein CK510_28380 [Calothrix elsteri CCALA 953]